MWSWGGGGWTRPTEAGYEQLAAEVEEDEEREREDERRMAKRSDLNELDVPEWAVL
jgi:hypothetical protein